MLSDEHVQHGTKLIDMQVAGLGQFGDAEPTPCVPNLPNVTPDQVEVRLRGG